MKPRRDDPRFRDLAYIPGPPRIPRELIRKAVQEVVKASKEKELGRPVRLSELKRDPRLPPILDPPYWRKAAPVKSKIAKQTQIAVK